MSNPTTDASGERERAGALLNLPWLNKAVSDGHVAFDDLVQLRDAIAAALRPSSPAGGESADDEGAAALRTVLGWANGSIGHVPSEPLRDAAAVAAQYVTSLTSRLEAAGASAGAQSPPHPDTAEVARKLGEVMELSAKASGGHWELTDADDGADGRTLFLHNTGDTICFGDPNHRDPDDEATLTFIAAAVNFIREHGPSLSAQLSRVEAERDEWERAAYVERGIYQLAVRRAEAAEAERDALQARVKELEEALWPFAKEARQYDDMRSGSPGLPDNTSIGPFTLGNLRKADRALAKVHTEGGRSDGK